MRGESSQRQRLVQFRVQDSLSAALDSAAGRHLQSKSEYVRQSVLTALRADGFDPARHHLQLHPEDYLG